MPQPPPNKFSVIGRSLMVSAVTMFLVAFLIGRGTLALEEAARPLVTGLLDVAIGAFFMRKGRSG
jgi:fucose permease